MYVKKLKRICDVKGCKSKETYALSLTRDFGKSVIICKSCLGKALGAIDDVDPITNTNIKQQKPTGAPPLFFNQKNTAPLKEAPAEEPEETATETEPNAEVEETKTEEAPAEEKPKKKQQKSKQTKTDKE